MTGKTHGSALSDESNLRLMWSVGSSDEIPNVAPTPRENAATMWVTCNHHQTAQEDLQAFFHSASHELGKVQFCCTDGSMSVRDRNHEVVLHGWIHEKDWSVGRYAVFQTFTEAGCQLITLMAQRMTQGYAAFVFHDGEARQSGTIST